MVNRLDRIEADFLAAKRGSSFFDMREVMRSFSDLELLDLLDVVRDWTEDDDLSIILNEVLFRVSDQVFEGDLSRVFSVLDGPTTLEVTVCIAFIRNAVNGAKKGK